MRLTTIVITALALVATVELAISRCSAEEAPNAGPGAYQALRVGDGDMTCPQLAAEASSLNATLAAQQKARSDAHNRRVAGAAAGGLLKTAGRFGLARFGGGLGGSLFARAVSDTAANTAGQVVAGRGQDDEAAAANTPEQQRMTHVQDLYKEKNC